MRNDLRIETSDGIVSLDNCQILKVKTCFVIIRWMPTKLFVFDDELEKLEKIVKTQLLTAREFYVNEEKDFIVFEYPLSGVKGFKRSQKCGRFDESI